jgi:hypothetical protein
MSSPMQRADQRAWEDWLALRERIRTETTVPVSETPDQQTRRKASLLESFPKFCEYYFPHYCQSPFGWFHLKAAKLVQADPNIFLVLEWPREHAKSVFADVLLPMYLKAKGELNGMIVVSANEDKAKGLLGDVQAELMDNRRYAYDYGTQFSLGNWQDGSFATADGCGFWAFGRGQSPRGTRSAEKRPDYAVVDDIDDAVIVRNKSRVTEAVDWVLGDLYGALSIQKARLVVAGNRIHRQSILAHLVGNVEEGEEVREGVTHLPVYALENKRHQMDEAGQPAWKERYTREMLLDKFSKMGYRVSRREYFHMHLVDGNVFKSEHTTWIKPLPLKKYDALCTYVDPSFKDSRSSDYKGLVLVGRTGSDYHVIRAWVRQASVAAMVAAHCDIVQELGEGSGCRHYMEANFLQDLILHDYDQECSNRGMVPFIRPDQRSKSAKDARIETLSPLHERGKLAFAEHLRGNVDMKTLLDQLYAFPQGHDDGPDAVEGAVWLLSRSQGRSGSTTHRTGNYSFSNSRKI